METLRIASTKTTPEIVLDPNENLFFIKGESRPESVKDFFRPVFEWLDKYYEEIKNDKTVKIEFNFYFEYINSSSFKYLLELMKKLTYALNVKKENLEK